MPVAAMNVTQGGVRPRHAELGQLAHNRGTLTGGGEGNHRQGEECPISPGEPGTWRTSLQHLDLGAGHDDLDASLDGVETINAMNPKNLGDSTDPTGGKREGRDPRGCPDTEPGQAAFGCVHPTGLY